MSSSQPSTAHSSPHPGGPPAAPIAGSRIRVLVCDDDAMVRRAVASYLAAVRNIDVVAEAADVSTAQRMLAGCTEGTGPGSGDAVAVGGVDVGGVDVVLLDLRMPGHDADGHTLAAWVATQPRRPRMGLLSI